MAEPCPLCRTNLTERFVQVDGHDYFRCGLCELRFLGRAYLPSAHEERAQYDLHENAVGDPGYEAFLNRLAEPLKQKLKPGADGLDFGCGPGPALADMMQRAGHAMAVYDPFYAPNKAVLDAQYGFVTCTEVVEHFHDPAREFQRLDALLVPGGWLGIMTCFQTDDARFAAWHYRKDPTHVVFYREATFSWLAEKMGWTIEVPCKDVVLVQKL